VEETADEEELPPDWGMEALLSETYKTALEKARETTEGYNRRWEICLGGTSLDARAAGAMSSGK
jgi:hypothetical protein